MEKKITLGFENLRLEWVNRYHTIGNFTPIPWPENLQRKHRNQGERWDYLLKYCRNHWNDWNKDKINYSFEEYMKMTCQHLYYNDIYINFKKKYGNTLDKITDNEWKNLIDEWNNIIDQNKALKLVSFDGEIEETLNTIIFIIEASVDVSYHYLNIIEIKILFNSIYTKKIQQTILLNFLYMFYFH